MQISIQYLLVSCLGIALLSCHSQPSGGVATVECNRVQDAEKKAFNNLKPIVVDIDGDGQLDQLVPKTYALPVTPHKSEGQDQPTEQHWLAFDLVLSSGERFNSIFKYQYGDSRADYWVWAFIPCGKGLPQSSRFVFYSGDDESDITIILEYRRGAFRTIKETKSFNEM